MGATQDFLAEMQKRRQMQLQRIQQMLSQPAQQAALGQMSSGGSGGGGGNGLQNVMSLGSLAGTAAQAGLFGAGAAATAGAAGGGLAGLLALFSSRRFKHSIEEIARVGDLRWVSFQYLPEIDPEQTLRLGLIAEEVQSLHPELVVLDGDGLPLAIHYDRLRADQWP